MNVMILATKSCIHRPILERELRDLGISYTLQFVEDHPEVAERLGINNSPNLVVDDKVVFHRLPTISELKTHFRN